MAGPLFGWPAARAVPLIKICGIRTPQMAVHAAEAGADMIGVVHFAPSPRHLDAAGAATVADAVRGSAMVVALVVDAEDAALDTLVETARPDAIQLHGKETPERATAIAARYRLPVSKAHGIGTAADLPAITTFNALPVLDAKPPKGADRPGGHGAAFDWSILTEIDRARQFMLSGGLTAENVATAVATVRPYAVDVSSGVEIDGEKDAGRIVAFIDAVRRGSASAG
ncbi:phosphoribosylanthranilate isomerase [Acuticoccus sp. MNP-M23]|uniref:phosphoribosylanthranilate isomerase n=1 Tax=Acuticoccus sp. MNP-M23 TaxID=3072793 RepID=UPI002815F041|nr:phosphoribosylanthranilate isomerase [Acuticoccus sp. MNP-M23]WMS44912.1 phosphoribosylanthranilate isomerase [Acuticoccus sp. MNP-M23]